MVILLPIVLHLESASGSPPSLPADVGDGVRVDSQRLTCSSGSSREAVGPSRLSGLRRKPEVGKHPAATGADGAAVVEVKTVASPHHHLFISCFWNGKSESTSALMWPRASRSHRILVFMVNCASGET